MLFGLFKKKPRGMEAAPDANALSLACICAMHAMALCDGKLSPEEKAIIIEITSAFKRDLMTPDEILALVEQTMEHVQSGGEAQWAHFFARFAPLSGEDKKFILHGAGSIALADQELHVTEQQLLAKLALWMAMRDADFKEWLAEFDERVAHERSANGLRIVGKLEG